MYGCPLRLYYELRVIQDHWRGLELTRSVVPVRNILSSKPRSRSSKSGVQGAGEILAKMQEVTEHVHLGSDTTTEVIRRVYCNDAKMSSHYEVTKIFE